MNIEYLRRLKYVNRLSRVPTLRTYNVLEHGFMTLALFDRFASLEDVSYNIQDFKLVLYHDLLESISGDMPYDIKRMNGITEHSWNVIETEVVKAHPQLNRYTDKQIKDKMNPRAHELFKTCDLLDLWIFIREEQELGNQSSELARIRDKCYTIIREGNFKEINRFMDTYKF